MIGGTGKGDLVHRQLRDEEGREALQQQLHLHRNKRSTGARAFW